jgi:hypothetical protein
MFRNATSAALLMKKATLMFETTEDLHRFERLIDSKQTDVNLRRLTITIEWDEAKIELGINAFNATVFELD